MDIHHEDASLIVKEKMKQSIVTMNIYIVMISIDFI